jgi:flap endonuclease-1
MGIKINELVKTVKNTLELKELNNRSIAIDAFNTIYQFLAIIRQRDGTPLKDYEGNVTSHLSGLFYRTTNFMKNGIKPIYVFDGIPSDLKLKTIAERKKIKEDAREKMIIAQEKGDDVEARKFAQMTSKLDSNMLEDSKKLIKYLGIPVIEGSSEGEAQSAYLVEVGDAWGCASQDYDTLLFGGKRLIRNFAVQRRQKIRNTVKTLEIEIILLEEFLKKFDITREQLVEMGILIGTDFFPGIKGIGQHKALDLIKKYESLNNLMKSEIKLGKIEIKLTEEKIEEIKDIFLNPDIKSNYPKIKWGKVNNEKIEEFMIEQHNFSEKRIKKALEDLGQSQKTIDEFFM